MLMTMHDQGVSSLEDRLRGLQDELKAKNIRVKVRVTGNDSVKGAQIVKAELDKNPDIRIVLCTGQADTEAAGRADPGAFLGKGILGGGV